MAKTRPGALKKARAKRGHRGQPQPRSAATAFKNETANGPPQKTVRIYLDEAMASRTQGDAGAALESARAAFTMIDEAETVKSKKGHNTVLDGVGKAAVCALLGEILLDSGEVDVARQVLMTAALLDPEGALPDALGGGPDKFLYLAQLSEAGGHDSIDYFTAGLDSLRHRLQALDTENQKMNKRGGGRSNHERETDGSLDEDSDDGNGNSKAQDIRNKMAQALCAMAEVWMTDLSFEAECEEQCEKLVTEASLLAPNSPEVWQTLASVRVSQQRPLDARAAIQRGLDLWVHLPPDHQAVPAFSVRVGLVRLLLTIGWLDKAASIATTRLLREDDEAVEVWYLAGYAHYLQGQELREGGGDRGEEDERERNRSLKNTADEGGSSTDEVAVNGRWEEYWLDARRCLGRCLREFRRQEYEDERLGEHAAELLQEVVAAVGPAPEDEAEEDEGEWIDENDENGREDGGEEDAEGGTEDEMGETDEMDRD